MEKIQSSTAATLDRMASLQQRYRQHKEAMNSDSSDKSRRTSTTSTIDSSVSHAPCFLPFTTCFNRVFLLFFKSLFHSSTAHPFPHSPTNIGKMPCEDPIVFVPCQHLLQVIPIKWIIRNLLLIRLKRVACRRCDEQFQCHQEISHKETWVRRCLISITVVSLNPVISNSHHGAWIPWTRYGNFTALMSTTA